MYRCIADKIKQYLEIRSCQFQTVLPTLCALFEILKQGNPSRSIMPQMDPILAEGPVVVRLATPTNLPLLQNDPWT